MELLDLVVNRTHYVIEGSPLSKLKTSPEIYTIFYSTTQHHLPNLLMLGIGSELLCTLCVSMV